MQLSDITLVHHLLENSAIHFSENTAVIHGQRRITFQELNRKANQLASFIYTRIEKGDRIGIIFKNSIEYVITYFAIFKAGCIAVPLNSDNSADSLAVILNDCTVKGLVGHYQFREIISHLSVSVPSLEWMIIDGQDNQNNFPNAIEIVSFSALLNDTFRQITSNSIIDADIACILYTSGSTGKPKGVTLSHLNIITNTKSIVSYLKLSQTDKVIVVLPFHYCYGKSLMHTHFLVGGSVILENRFLYPNLVLNTLQEQEATGFSGVPSTFAVLLNHTNFANIDFPALRYVTQAGGAMAPTLIERLMKAIPDKKIYIMYGATEASARLSYLEPSDLPSKIGSIGKAIPNVELSIVKENGEKAKPGEVGEIVARGSNIMLGYWNDRGETKKVLKADGYHTGDLAKMDEDGYFYVVGRKKDMLKVGGNRFSAKEVEEILCRNPAIDEVAIVGVKDTILGEAIKAYIVPRPGNDITAQEIKDYCANKLAKYKIPQRIEFLNKLPKNSSGKVLKEKLQYTDLVANN